MKLIISIFLMIGIVALGFQLYRLYVQQFKLREDFAKVGSRVEVLTKENENLQADILYFSNPENLEKELRARFNYVKPGEKLIILVPKQQ